jgi:hypothetical protein
MTAFPENELEKGLEDASQGHLDVDAWVQELVRSRVWVPLQGVEGASGSFPVLSIDGGSYVPVFTSEGQINAAAGAGQRVNPPVAELVASLPESVGLAVNPGGTVGLPLPAAVLRQALGMSSTISAGTTVRIGEPAEEPTQLLEAVADTLAEVEAVRAARRCWAAVGESRPGLVLGLDVDPDNEGVRAAALEAVRRAVGAGTADFPVDVVFDNDRDEFTSWMASNADPFFVR